MRCRAANDALRRREIQTRGGRQRLGIVDMDLIRSFCEKLRALAVTLDVETARLQRALDGEDSGERGGRGRRAWERARGALCARREGLLA